MTPSIKRSVSVSRGLAFHPRTHALATLGQSGTAVRIWDLDFKSVVGAKRLASSMCYSKRQGCPSRGHRRWQVRFGACTKRPSVCTDGLQPWTACLDVRHLRMRIAGWKPRDSRDAALGYGRPARLSDRSSIASERGGSGANRLRCSQRDRPIRWRAALEPRPGPSPAYSRVTAALRCVSFWSLRAY